MMLLRSQSPCQQRLRVATSGHSSSSGGGGGDGSGSSSSSYLRGSSSSSRAEAQQLPADLWWGLAVLVLVTCVVALNMALLQSRSSSRALAHHTSAGGVRRGSLRRAAHGHRHSRHDPQQQQQTVSIFLGVLSRAANVKNRQAVRDTWGSDPRLARVMFFVLRPYSDEVFDAVRREAAEYGDVHVNSEVREHYYNITYSTLAIFKAASHAPELYTHVAKTDDDCYVWPGRLVAALEGLPRMNLYAGFPMEPGVPKRTKGWHYVPYDVFEFDHAVRYAYGGGYVLSMDLAMHIAVGAAHVVMDAAHMLNIEDLAVGYWVDFLRVTEGLPITYSTDIEIGEDGCFDNIMFMHITKQPKWRYMRCMHRKGGQCC